MKRALRAKKCIALCLCALATAFCAVGCSEDGSVDASKREIGITSYVATETAVYNSTAEVVAAVADTVVEIATESVKTQWGAQYIVSGAGSGVIIGKADDADKYFIVTNNHVISGANDITVRLRSGVDYKAALVATDEAGDIAVVSIETDAKLSVATWGDSDSLSIGEDVIAIGNPLGSLGGTVTKGILSATGRSIAVGDHTMTLLQTDTAINPGNSGGGLFNMRGVLVGVVNAKTTDEEIEGICFAIPSNEARRIAEDLMKNGVVTGRVTFGIEVKAATMQTGLWQSENIVYVTDAEGAQDNTFELFDRIGTINGKPISTLLQFNNALGSVAPGDEVRVTVYRGTSVGLGIQFASEPTEFTVTAKQLSAK